MLKTVNESYVGLSEILSSRYMLQKHSQLNILYTETRDRSMLVNLCRNPVGLAR